jgi:RND family efflux transporter MFP subunit
VSGVIGQLLSVGCYLLRVILSVGGIIMSNVRVLKTLPRVAATTALLAGLATAYACSSSASGATKSAAATQETTTTAAGATAPAVIDVAAAAAIEQPIVRTLRVTGSFSADEQAQVAAETAGRIVKTPVERGSRVKEGDLLIQISAVQTSAQLEEACANLARTEAGLGIKDGASFDVERVPDVASAKADLTLAEADYGRFKSLLDQRVVSQAEYDTQRSRVEANRQKYESKRNAAQQDYRSLEAARARVTMANKSLSDTTVRAPFAGEVVERKVSVGDFVNTGTAVATVVRINPLRLLVTVPEQSVSLVQIGQPVRLQVDAYPDRTFTGTIRYVSPSLQADQRALTVEAVVPNADGALKPGFFATAFIEQPKKTPAVLIDRRLVHEVGTTKRVFVITGDHVEERIVTLGQEVGPRVEVVSGLRAGESVATSKATLTDGAHVRVTASANAALLPPVPATAPATAPAVVPDRSL